MPVLSFARKKPTLCGIPGWALHQVYLLFVGHHNAFVFLALRISSIDCDSAALAISREHHVSGQDKLAVFFGSDVKRAVIDLFH